MGIGSTPIFELRSCGPVYRESLPYPGYGRSGARPIQWLTSRESLSEFSVVCHERVRCSEHDAVSEMEVGPPESAYRGWLQTAVCC